MGGDEFVLIGAGVEIEQVITFGIYFATLVEFTTAYAHIVVLNGHGHLDEFEC